MTIISIMSTQIVESIIDTSLHKMFMIRNEFEIGNENNRVPSMKIIYPCKWRCDKKDDIRISEQEIRFIFTSELENETKFEGYYSVETPTQYKYRFKGEVEPCVDVANKETNYSSASVDVCVYDQKLTRVNLIEFKAYNVERFDIQKDLLKLMIESNDVCFFVHILKTKNNGTLYSLKKDKYQGVIDKYIASISSIYKKYEKYINTKKIIFYIADIKQKAIEKKIITIDDISRGDYRSLM